MALPPSSPLSALPPSSDPANFDDDEARFGEAGPLPSLFPYIVNEPTTIPGSDATTFRASSPVVGTREQKKAIRRSKKLRRLEEARSDNGRVRRLVFDSVLKQLSDNDLTFGDLMEYVFDPLVGQGSVRWGQFFVKPGRATQILNWWVSSKNSRSAQNEVAAWAYEYTAGAVSDEARQVTKSKKLQTMGKTFDEELVMSFSFDWCQDLLERTLAPVAMSIFRAFSDSGRERKEKRMYKTNMVATSAALACLGEYSHANNYSKHMIGLYLYASGAQRQAISIMSTLGISAPWSSIVSNYVRRDKTTGEVLSVSQGTLRRLSESMRNTNREIAESGLNQDVYDNVNIDDPSPEQIIGRHTEQENGTCATLIPLHKAKLDDMKVSDFQDRFLRARKLQFDDIIHTTDEAKQLRQNLIFAILRIIVNYSGSEELKKFEKQLSENEPASADKVELHKTKLYPLPAMKIDESTIKGNADVDLAVAKELLLNFEVLGTRKGHVRFKGGDQLSLSRLRSLELIRAGQEDKYGGFFWGVWVPGLFHVKIADTTGTFINHWGKPDTGKDNPGSLWWHNTVLNRLPVVLTSMPTFRISRDLIFVSLYARILHCLLLVSKSPSLEAYAAEASWDGLVADATKIYDQFATPSVASELRTARTKEQKKNDRDGNKDKAPTKGDMLFENGIYFIRDALMSREFSDAIKCGDSGRVVLVLKTWALAFRGNGRTKYAYEMLHLIHHLEAVWSPEIRHVATILWKILLNNWIINPTGNPNSFIEIDLAQEHLNYWIKVFYKAHGSAATWEWLEMIAPTVEVLRRLSKMFHASLGVDQGTKHAPAELSKDIKALMDNLDHYDVYVLKEGRVFDDPSQCAPDAVEIGFHALSEGLKSPLHEYNEAFQRLQMRRRMKPVGRERTDTRTTPDIPPTTQRDTPEIKSESSSERNVDQASRGSSRNSVAAEASWDEEEDIEEEDKVLLRENPLYGGDVGEGDGDEAALARRTEADVAFDMDVEEVDDDDELVEVESESDGEVEETDYDTDTDEDVDL